MNKFNLQNFQHIDFYNQIQRKKYKCGASKTNLASPRELLRNYYLTSIKDPMGVNENESPKLEDVKMSKQDCKSKLSNKNFSKEFLSKEIVKSTKTIS